MCSAQLSTGTKVQILTGTKVQILMNPVQRSDGSDGFSLPRVRP
jgi:hypothetical protein